MAEGAVSSGGLRGIMNPLDWATSPTTGYFQDQLYNDREEDDDEDDDFDPYYMDLPPIDMTERLKEVNRALAEDSTPVEGNRITKLRFKEVIAEYQSPRESDSDDGYGDSSDIMFDAEEENDILYSKISAQSDTVTKHIPSDDQETKSKYPSPEELSDDVMKLLPLSNSMVIPDVQESTALEQQCEVIKPILKREFDSEDEDEILEEILDESSSPVGGSATIILGTSIPNALGNVGLSKDKEDNVFEHSKSNGRFSKSYRKGQEVSELDSDIEEDLEGLVQEDTTRISSTGEETTLPLVTFNYDYISGNFGSRVKHKHDLQQLDSNTSISTTANNINKKSLELPVSNKHNLVENKLTRFDKIYSGEDENVKPRKASLCSSEQSSTKTSKPYVKLSSNHVIPTIKSNLLSPPSLNFNSAKKSKGSRPVTSSSATTASNRTSRPRTTTRIRPSSPVKSPSPSVSPVRTSRAQTGRKGSPLPRRKPLRAVHDSSFVSTNDISVDQQSLFARNAKTSWGVKKAASTSDLYGHRQLNAEVFERWLKEKNRHAAISKKQKEYAKASEEVEAATKLQERKRLAEEAFQQWLRRKEQQLKAEKRLRAQQRRLDQQSSYARTRVQCEEAYQEWCKCKQEEMAAMRRVTGMATVRSRSLERTWIQEKTRKLYSAYISKH